MRSMPPIPPGAAGFAACYNAARRRAVALGHQTHFPIEVPVKGDPKELGFSTRAIHAGQAPDPTTGAVAVPIYQTSTYVQPALGEPVEFEYARVQNPTRFALEENVAQLEGGISGHAFASGMAAISGLATLLKAGDHAVVSRDVYGGTYRYFTKILENYQLSFSWVDTTDLDAVRAALRPETRMVYLETPTNPMMEISDLAAISEIAHGHGAFMAVDNTFLSPYLQRPLDFGADVVVHSTTKFLNGHSDSIGGVLVAKRPEHSEWFYFVQKSAGAILSPFDSFLTMRGIKTLAVRQDRHESNARAVADFLARQPKVERLLYPGLPDHPGHEIHKRQAKGFGSMISFDLGSFEVAKTVLDRVRVISLAESLGGVESLISHPVTMTHASVPPERRAELRLTDSLVRISVGIEDVEDLLADLEQALA
jgi:cystathionine beta-lyase/cystathionine gamma-synthase